MVLFKQIHAVKESEIGIHRTWFSKGFQVFTRLAINASAMVSFSALLPLNSVLAQAGGEAIGGAQIELEVNVETAEPIKLAYIKNFVERGVVDEVKSFEGFYIAKHEVTQGQYQAVMGENPSWFKGDSNRPVEQVSWLDAVKFCNELSKLHDRTPSYIVTQKTLSYRNGDTFHTVVKTEVAFAEGADGFRLPTEKEWEHACRAGTTTEYHSGTDLRVADANFDSDSQSPGETVVVGSFKANDLGLFDMHGNVHEWCQDMFRSSDSDSSGVIIESDTKLVIRGGGWDSKKEQCSSSARDFCPATRVQSNLGFRIVVPPVRAFTTTADVKFFDP